MPNNGPGAVGGGEVEEYDLDYQPGLAARVYRPSADAAPAVLDVHGGVWSSGDRTNNATIDRALARRGVLVVAIDFRQPPTAQYPASIADVHYGIRWLRAHATELGGRPDAVGGIGTSTGGHQLLLNVLRPRDPRYAALTSPHVSEDVHLDWLLLGWPILDPPFRYRWAQDHGRDSLVRGHEAYWPDEAAMSEGSPQRILDAGEARDLALPPVLLLQGGADDNVPPEMPERFAASYCAAGGSLRLEYFPGCPHAFIGRDPDGVDSLRALDLMSGFVHEHAAGAAAGRR
jgi:acetyl esterase